MKVILPPGFNNRVWSRVLMVSQRVVRDLLRTVVIVSISFVVLYPLILMVSMAFMSPDEIYDVTVVWIPRSPTLANFRPVIAAMDYVRSLANSLSLATLIGVLHVLSCSLIGYGLARFRFPGHRLVFVLVVAGLVVPPQTIMLPLFFHFRSFDPFGLVTLLRGQPGILDSFWPFILQSITGMGFKNGLYIILFRQLFKGMPKSLEEAAIIDGASAFSVFRKIMAPNATSIMVTVFLFSFVWQWNDDYFVSLYLTNTDVLPIALSTLAGRIGQMAGDAQLLDPYYVSMLNHTGSLLLVGPLLVVYGVAQRWFVESIERSGIVG